MGAESLSAVEEMLHIFSTALLNAYTEADEPDRDLVYVQLGCGYKIAYKTHPKVVYNNPIKLVSPFVGSPTVIHIREDEQSRVGAASSVSLGIGTNHRNVPIPPDRLCMDTDC